MLNIIILQNCIQRPMVDFRVVKSADFIYALNHSIFSPLCLVLVRAPHQACDTSHFFSFFFLSFSFFFSFFFLFSFTPLSRLFDYFSSYETGQSVGGQKRENPEKNHLAHPQAELGLSHMWPVRGSNPHQTQR